MKEIFRQLLLFNSGYTLHVGLEKLPLRDNREALKGRLGEIMEADKSKEILKLLYNGEEDEEPNLFDQQP